ncbi:MAG: prephenate dehydratase [Fidelibacterota bacterium]|nr:MAG: prephenate dehydratase [Candidatus Neomarinimicrobiota bacterium]
MSPKKATRIGIQGDEGSFSEEAAIEFCRRHGIEEFEMVYLITSECVLEAIDRDEVEVGVMAMENAQGGVVVESMIALAEYRCEIAEMFHVHVEQCLLGMPDLLLGDITEVHSHPQALRQCRNYLADKFWTRPLIDEDDTAHAAKRLMQGELPATAAVIGSRRCGELYGLAVLEAGIQDLKNNLTLFLGVKKWQPKKNKQP